MHRAQLAAVLTGTLVCLPPAPLASQNAPPPLDQPAMEEFLRTARIVRTRSAGKGVTGSIRATMQLGDLTHDAHIQTVDQTQREFRSAQGIEFNFRDKWQFNVAAYKIDQMLGLQLVPATVERRWNTEPASFTWWVDDVMMDEGERVKKQMVAPNQDCWSPTAAADAVLRSADREHRSQSRQPDHHEGVAAVGHRSHPCLPPVEDAGET